MVKKETTLHRLFINKLNTLLDIEDQIIKALPKMAENATDPELKALFEEHLEETESQAERVEQCLEALEEEPDPMESDAIRGLVKDTERHIKNVEEGAALDAALLASALGVEHFETAAYAVAHEWAKIMGHDEAADLLEDILTEEESAIEKLSDLADVINNTVEKGM